MATASDDELSLPAIVSSFLQERLELRQQVEQLQARVAQLEALHRPTKEFKAGQYNILAGYLGDNRQPWFLYGVDIPKEKRERIMTKFYQKDADGNFMNVGWPNYVTGILTDEEMATIVQNHERNFAWETRKARVLEEIIKIDADVLSLVELDCYEEYFKPALAAKGYDCVFKKRPRHRSQDGCGIAFRKSVFSLVASDFIEFVDREDPVTKKKAKDRIGLFALLKHATGRHLIFVSTHLARNPEDPNQTKHRAKQAAQLLQKLTEFADNHDALSTPVILAGDMNTTSMKKIANIARCVFELSDRPCHPFIFSAFAPRTLPTSVTTTRKMCIDYMLIQASLTVIDRPPLPKLTESDPIPNALHPSDHIPIAFRLSFQPESSNREAAAKGWVLMLLEDPRVAGEVPLTASDLRAAFDFFDMELDGCLDANELETALLDLGMLDKTKPLLAAVEREAKHSLAEKVEGGGALQFDEFVSAYQSAFMRSKASFQRDMQDAFDYFDTDNTGNLQKAELRESFSAACPFHVDEAVFDEIFTQLDQDGDGSVTPDEMADYLMTRFAKKIIAAVE